MRTARSSSCWWGVCLSACWDRLSSCGPDPPWVWAWRPPPVRSPSTSPLGMGLETCMACWDTTPPREQNSWHTLLKILPCPNFVAGGKNRYIFNSAIIFYKIYCCDSFHFVCTRLSLPVKTSVRFHRRKITSFFLFTIRELFQNKNGDKKRVYEKNGHILSNVANTMQPCTVWSYARDHQIMFTRIISLILRNYAEISKSFTDAITRQ